MHYPGGSGLREQDQESSSLDSTSSCATVYPSDFKQLTECLVASIFLPVKWDVNSAFPLSIPLVRIRCENATQPGHQ